MKNTPNMNGAGVKFERIRRITGYLVGTLDKFNNAKSSEVADRVAHGVGTGKVERIGERIEVAGS